MAVQPVLPSLTVRFRQPRDRREEADRVSAYGLPGVRLPEQAERGAMGFLRGRIVQETYPVVGSKMSALVIYLDANDGGPGFYQLAQDMGLLQQGVSKQAREALWIQLARGIFDHFRADGRL